MSGLRSKAQILTAWFLLLTASFRVNAESPNSAENSAPPIGTIQEIKPLPEDYDGELSEEVGFENITGKQLLTKWYHLIPIIRRIDSEREDAVIRILRQQLNAKIEIRRPLSKEEKKEKGVSKDDDKFKEVRYEIREWLKTYSEYSDQKKSMTASIEAFDRRNKTLKQLANYFLKATLYAQVKQYPIVGYTLLPGVVPQVGNSATVFNEPPLLELPDIEDSKPTEITKSPLVSSNVIDYSPKDLNDLVDMPSNLNSRRAVLKTIAEEAKAKQHVEKLLRELHETQAILHLRLDRLYQKKLIRNFTFDGKAVNKVEDFDDFKDVQNSKDMDDLRGRVAFNIERLFKPSRYTHSLRPIENVVNSIHRAKEIDAAANRLRIKKIHRSCATVLRQLKVGTDLSWKGIKFISEVPSKVLYVGGALAAAGAGAYIWVGNRFKSDKELAAIEAKRKAEERKKEMDADLQKIVDNVQSEQELEDKFFIFATKYWKDEAYYLMQEFRQHKRPSLDPWPGDLQTADGSPPKYEAFMFDHAKEMYPIFKEAAEKVSSALKNRRKNAQLRDEIKTQIGEPGRGMESTLPPLSNMTREQPSNKK